MPSFVYHFRTNPPKLEEMLNLRLQGWSYTALAEKYDCPKLTIRFLARRNGLGGNNIVVQVTRQDYLRMNTTPLEEVTVVQTAPEERISQGKTYAEYLKDEHNRKWRRLTQKHA